MVTLCSKNFKLLSQIKRGSKKRLKKKVDDISKATVLIRPVHRKAQLCEGQEGRQELSHQQIEFVKVLRKQQLSELRYRRHLDCGNTEQCITVTL